MLRIAEEQPPGLTLIGGQALNFWAERYRLRSPALEALALERPFTSADLDFIGPLAPRPSPAAQDVIDVAGELAVGETLARALHGQFLKAGLYGPRATLATLEYRDPGDPAEAPPRVVHFLGDMVGVAPADVARASVVVRGYLRVMNPVHCMESRISNVLSLASYRTDKARHQARVSIPCAREFVRELIDGGHIDMALDFNERIFAFARRRATGCAREGFRPFDALYVDDRLPERFLTIRYPQMQRAVTRGRGRG